MFTVNQICEALETASIDQSILDNVNTFAEQIRRGFGRPVKKESTSCMADRRYNQSITALNILIPA